VSAAAPGALPASRRQRPPQLCSTLRPGAAPSCARPLRPAGRPSSGSSPPNAALPRGGRHRGMPNAEGRARSRQRASLLLVLAAGEAPSCRVRSAAGHGSPSCLHVLHAPLVGKLLHRLLVGDPGKALLLEAVGPMKRQREDRGLLHSSFSEATTLLRHLKFSTATLAHLPPRSVLSNSWRLRSYPRPRQPHRPRSLPSRTGVDSSPARN